MSKLETVLEGIAFGEAPRWHNGRLVFSDMHTGRVLALNSDGTTELICNVSEQPSGIGWDQHGRMLIVSMKDRRLLRLNLDGTIEQVADLHGHAPWHCNDMVVSAQGRAYIGNFGFDLDGGGTFATTDLILVDTDGSARTVAEMAGRIETIRVQTPGAGMP